jgi:hypothetical protein
LAAFYFIMERSKPMFRKVSLFAGFLLISMLISASGISAQEASLANPTSQLASPLAMAFTYQGKLENASGPVNDYCDFEFKLYASPGGGDQVGETASRSQVLVEDGYFTVNDLDFGGEAFQGEARWLEVAVRCPAGSGDFELLSPRQEISAAPHALYAGRAPWSGLIGLPAGFADGVDNDTRYTAGSGLTLSGKQFSVDTGLIQARVGQACSEGSAIRVINANGTVGCESDDNTTYSAGAGLALSGTQFRVNFAGSGSASTASHSDHNHWGQTWSGSGTGLTLSGGSTGLSARGTTSGVRGDSNSTSGAGVYGLSTAGGDENAGVYGYATATGGHTMGVYGRSDSFAGAGVLGAATNTSGQNYGVMGANYSTSGRGVLGIAWASSGTTYGVEGESHSSSGTGVAGSAPYQGVLGEASASSGQGVVGNATASSGTTYGVVGYSTSPAGYAGYFRNTSSGVGLYAQTDSGSGNIIEAWSSFSDREFRVERGGTVRTDGSFIGGGADYAELLPGVQGLEPGDVLVIGPDGQLTRSTQPYQTNVAGVYSAQPGFIAGAGDESSDLTGQIPLAVIGIVKVKASAENGPIQPGDLLTTSSLAGHAMRCGEDPQVGTIIGKALEPLAEGAGVIKMLVVLQ